MKKISLLFILLYGLTANCQKIYLDGSKVQLKDSLNAKYFKVIFSDKNPKALTEVCYFITGEKESESNYILKSKKLLKYGTSTAWYKNGKLRSESNYAADKRNGKSSNWDESGQIKSEIYYTDDLYNGLLSTYWKNGVMKRKDYFSMGKFQNGTCYDSSGNVIQHYDYEIMPKYRGGEKQLIKEMADNVVYPKKSRNAGIQGKVLVRFAVQTDGSVTEIEVIQGINPELNNEAMRVVGELGRFVPGYCDGEPVPVYYMVPISFMLK